MSHTSRGALTRSSRFVLIIGVVVGLCVAIVVLSIFSPSGVFPQWTGLGAAPTNSQGQELPRAKTLWDWINLLIVPLVLALAAFWLNRSENRYALQIQERREHEAREIEDRREQEATLQAYLDHMTHLLLDKGLRSSKFGDEVQAVGHARTMTVLRRLNAVNKSIVIRFLYDADLIGNDAGKLTVINLSCADLSNIKLTDAFLSGVDFAKTNLAGADFSYSWLMAATFASANLEGANLSEAKLWNASLYKADLTDAKLDNAQVSGAKWDACKVTEEQLKSANHVDCTPE